MARPFSADELSSQLEIIKSLRKKQRYSHSRLNRYLAEIFHLRYAEQASYEDIALWLRTHRRIKISKQAIGNFINKHRNEMERFHG